MNKVFQPTVAAKVLGVGLLAVATVAVVGWSGIRGMLASDASVHSVLTHMRGLEEVKEAHVELLRAVLLEHESFSTAAPEDQQRNARASLDAIDSIGARLEIAERTIVSAEGKRLLEQIRDELPPWRAAVAHVVNANAADGDIIERLTNADRGANNLQRLLDKLTANKRDVAEAAAQQATATSTRARIQLIAFALLGLVVCVGTGVFIARNIVHPLKKSVEVLEAIATGDFTSKLELDRRDELGAMADALNGAVGSVQSALSEVRDAAEAVAAASYELSAAGDQISSGAQAQASSLEETSASLAEMTATVKQNAANAGQASEVAKNTRLVAEQGGQIVANAINAMAELNVAAGKIADIITTIDEIAFQTNLLALNAAVEAARAGEQGRGFAVVAGEVRNLAQRSATSAKEIRNLIRDSIGKVENGTTSVHRSGETLKEIVVAVEKMSVIVDGIASASRDQATGIDQLNRTVSQMDKVTQSNAAQTEELSGTAQSMSTQAEQLRQLVGRFTLHRLEQSTSRIAPKTADRPNGPRAIAIRQRDSERARLRDGEEDFAVTSARSAPDDASGEFHEF